MRSLAEAMITPPEADEQHEHVELGALDALTTQVAVGEQGGQTTTARR